VSQTIYFIDKTLTSYAYWFRFCFLFLAQISSNWKEHIVEVLKQSLGTLPIPYASKVDLYCGGKDGELWLGTVVHFDKDKNMITGIHPSVDEAQFHVNLSNFILPSTSKYTCKISVGTYTSDNLLLLNFSKFKKYLEIHKIFS